MSVAVQDTARLAELAKEVRREAIKMIHEAKSGHPGGSLSAADICTALMFGGIMNHKPDNPRWEDRDRFIMSKGHCIPAWYAALAIAGYFDKSELPTLRKIGSKLQGHPDCVRLDCIEASTGSLGQGVSVGMGMALAAKMDQKDYNVFVMIGDGESQEGQVWEAAMAAPNFQLDNLCVIFDYNKIQLDDRVDEILPVDPVPEKWESFNWNVIRIDGHDYEQIFDAFEKFKSTTGKPTCIVADTIKGKGVSFMEDDPGWHGKATDDEQLQKALAELE